MTLSEFENDIKKGESLTVEFKSWIKAKTMKERIALAVDELVAFANAKGGTLYFGIEDNGEITGCTDYDLQNIIEGVYDRTRPALYAEYEVINHPNGDVIALHVDCGNGVIYATSSGKCLKRLGKNSKPFYPEEMTDRYSVNQNPDFTGLKIVESSEDDIDKLEIYKLKEKLKTRDPKSSLVELDDIAFLRDLELVKDDDGELKLTIAGLLFVGKEQSLRKLFPQAEVIYLHYSDNNTVEYDARMDLKLPIISVIDRLTTRIQDTNKIVNVQVGLFRLEILDYPENVFQEALLNALTHRDYQSQAAVYVKHYPDRIVIENPGGFIDGINESNIITHPSAPRNKLIAETLQRLKYVQRTGQGVDIIYREMVSSGKSYPIYRSYGDAITLTIYSAIDDVDFVKAIAKEQNDRQKNFTLSELMVLRYLTDNRRITIAEVERLIQDTHDLAQKTINGLRKAGLVEVLGKSYMLTAQMYEKVKSSVEYTKDKSIDYVKAKGRIMDYLEREPFITNEQARELCGYSKQQARITLDKMRKEYLIELVGRGRSSRYIKLDKNSKKLEKTR